MTTDVLEIQTPTMITKELKAAEHHDVAVVNQEENVDPKLAAQAEQIVAGIFSIDPKAHREKLNNATAISNLGARVQQEIRSQSAMLKQPMTKLVNDAEDGGPVAQSLLSLQEKTNDINPNRINFNAGGLARLLAKIPGVGTPVSRWIAKYQSVDGVIKDIVKSLEDGQGQLKRDNAILQDDQVKMRELTQKLEDFVKMGQLMDGKIEQKLNSIGEADPRFQFIQEEILFPLRQRILDLQQQLAVNQQGVLTIEVIIRNNKQLINGVQRSLNVTVTALGIAATLALALQTQKKVLEGVQAVNKTTDDLIAQTAAQLKTQGAEIHKQAAGAQLDIDKLKQAFSDVEQALSDINRFRREALPTMASSIVEMDKLTGDMEKSIQKLEGGTKAQDELVFDIK